MNPRSIIIHHSLTSDGKTVDTQAIRRYHKEVNGWKDNGYHYLLDMVGTEYEIIKGRMDNEDGAHCIGFNDDSIGICVVGNFDIAAPSDTQLNLLAKLCRSLMEIYGIKSDRILGHRETYTLLGKPQGKSCPGVFFPLDHFRQML